MSVRVPALGHATCKGVNQGMRGFLTFFVYGILMAVLSAALSACTTVPGGSPGTSTQATERAKLRLALAAGYFEQAQYAVALDEVKLALQTDPTSVDALNLQGLALMRLNQTQAATQSFEQALRFKPQDPDTLHNLAWLRCQQGQYVQADRTFEQALAQPSYPRAAKSWTSRGLCQILAGQHAAALQSLWRAEALAPGQALVNYNLGWILWRHGDFSRAQSYTRALNNSPQANAESLWLGMRVERALGNPHTVAQLADQLRKRYPMSAELQAYERGRFDE